MTFRERVRARLREEILDTAYAVATTDGWDRLRVADLAYEVEVSRQTIYKEFGSKDGLAEALVLREAAVLVTAVAEQFALHPDDIAAGLRAAVGLVLDNGAENALIHAIVRSARATGPNNLLPLLTTRAAPLLATTTGVVARYLSAAESALDERQVDLVADTLVRLVLSHVLLPGADSGEAAAHLAALAVRSLGLNSTVGQAQPTGRPVPDSP